MERVEFSETNLDALQVCLDGSYDGILDINSKLPYIVVDDAGTRFVDALHAPFYNYILDHPLYHHPGLVFPLERYHAIAIDQCHGTYMEQYYPHLQSVDYLPLAGTMDKEFHNLLEDGASQTMRQRFHEQYQKRTIPLLFCGTYLDREMVNLELHGRGQVDAGLPGMKHYEEVFYNLAMELIAAWNPEVETMEEALHKLLIDHCPQERSVDNRIREVLGVAMAFPELMNRLYAVDRFVRNESRTDILLELAHAGLEMAVLGEGWEATELANLPNVTLLPGCPMEESFHYMADARMVLDINPLFHRGLHDRVTSAMANGALCISNMSPETVPSKGVLLYTRSQVKSLIEQIAELTDEEMETMAWQGYQDWQQGATWEKVAQRILGFVKRDKEKRG